MRHWLRPARQCAMQKTLFDATTMDEINSTECQGACGQGSLVSMWQWTHEKHWSMAVLLHVYDISWITSSLGMPFFHIGVEVFETEVSFGKHGIQCFSPGGYDPPKHKQAILLGHTNLSKPQFGRLLVEVYQTWNGKDYQMIGNNCQTFAVHFCRRLGLARSQVPREYRAFASFDSFDCSLCCQRSVAEELSSQSKRRQPIPIVSL